MSLKEKLKQVVQAMQVMPYKWSWIALMICSAVLFSWWDEILVWTVAVAWNWLIVPVYYFLEYCVLIPLTLLLAKKTYQKLNVPVDLRQVFSQSLKNSLPVLVYRKLKGRKSWKVVRTESFEEDLKGMSPEVQEEVEKAIEEIRRDPYGAGEPSRPCPKCGKYFFHSDGECPWCSHELGEVKP